MIPWYSFTIIFMHWTLRTKNRHQYTFLLLVGLRVAPFVLELPGCVDVQVWCDVIFLEKCCWKVIINFMARARKSQILFFFHSRVLVLAKFSQLSLVSTWPAPLILKMSLLEAHAQIVLKLWFTEKICFILVSCDSTVCVPSVPIIQAFIWVPTSHLCQLLWWPFTPLTNQYNSCSLCYLAVLVRL